MIIATLASCDQVNFGISFFSKFTFALSSLKQNLEKSYILR